MSEEAGPGPEAPRRARPPVVGLLGGVAAGKSTVAGMLRDEGALVLDADELAHEALEDPGVKRTLVDRFGGDILDARGAVDRRALGRIVFGSGDSRALEELEALVHPIVRERILQVLEESPDLRPAPPLIVLDVPLLLESSLASHCDRLLFIAADPQRRRLQGRSRHGWSPEEIERREARQADVAAKKRAADLVIENSGTLEDLRERVRSIFAILTARP